MMVLLSSQIVFPQTSVPDTAELIQQLRNGNNQQAVTLADWLLTTHPGDCSILSLKAIALGNLNRQQDALHTFSQVIRKCPTYLPALEGAAQIEYAQHRPDAASTLRRILALQPANVTAHAMVASLLRLNNQCVDALSHFEASRTLFTTRPDLLQGYASCLAETGDSTKALEHYTLLLEAVPNDAVRYDVAVLQWKTGAPEKALDTLAPLLHASQFEPAFRLASHIEEERGETPRAVELLRTAIQLAPDTVDNYLDFANIAFNHKSFQVGIDMIDAGLERSPQAAPLYLARGVLEVQLTRNDAAITDFEQAHRLDPKLSFAMDAMGIMNSQQHDNAAALKLFEAQVEVHPDDPILQYLLAEQLSRTDTEATSVQLQRAIAAADRATKLDPHYQPAHDLLASLYVRAKQPQLAIKEAELALASDPYDEGALFQELMARRRSGDTGAIQELTARLKAARAENNKNQQKNDRYRLQDDIPHP